MCNIVVHVFSRTQALFAIACALEDFGHTDIEQVFILAEPANGKITNLSLFEHALKKLGIKVSFVNELAELQMAIGSKSIQRIYSASTFPYRIYLKLLLSNIGIKVVNTEEGLGSYEALWHNLRYLLRQGWPLLAVRKLLAVPVFYLLNSLRVSQRKRLLKNDLSINVGLKCEILRLFHLMHGSGAAVSKERTLCLPIDFTDVDRWVGKFPMLTFKPHPRFADLKITEKVSPEDLDFLTAEEAVHKYGYGIIVGDHSSALVYSNILFGISAYCDLKNRWRVSDRYTLQAIKKYCDNFDETSVL